MQIHTQTFVIMCIFITFSLGLAIYANIRNRMQTAQTGDSQSAYFLAGRAMGPVVLFLTIFSTTFSGTLVVWLPLQAAWLGLPAAGRVATFIGCFQAGQMINPAYRIVGSARRHTTIGEFYTGAHKF